MRKEMTRFLHNVVDPVVVKVKESQLKPRFNKKEGDYFLDKKPFYISQFGGAKRSSMPVYRGSIHDKQALRKFGANSQQEFDYWAWRACAIAAVQMVLKTKKKDFNETTMDLIKDGLELGGYDVPTDFGWYHKSLIELLKKRGVDAEMKKTVPSMEVAKFVDDNNYVLCSLESDFGGHIVLVYGYKVGRKGALKGFWLNDPSDYYHKGEGRYLSKSDFEKQFKRRVIIVN